MNPAVCPSDILSASGAAPPTTKAEPSPEPSPKASRKASMWSERCAHVPKDPTQFLIDSVSFAPYIGRVVSFLLEARGDMEFSFIGIPSEKDPSIIDDIALMKQTVNPAHTTPDLDSFIETIEKIPAAQKTILYWFHTHPPGITKPSSNDWSTLSHLTSPSRPVFMGILVRDRPRTTFGNLRFALPTSNPLAGPDSLYIHDSLLPIEFLDADASLPSIDFPAWLVHFDSLVSRPTPTSYDYHGPSSLAINASSLNESIEDEYPEWDPAIDDIATSFLFDFSDDPSLLSSINTYYSLSKPQRKAVRRCMLDYLEIWAIEGNHDQILSTMIPPKDTPPNPKRDECARFLYTAR